MKSQTPHRRTDPHVDRVVGENVLRMYERGDCSWLNAAGDETLANYIGTRVVAVKDGRVLIEEHPEKFWVTSVDGVVKLKHYATVDGEVCLNAHVRGTQRAVTEAVALSIFAKAQYHDVKYEYDRETFTQETACFRRCWWDGSYRELGPSIFCLGGVLVRPEPPEFYYMKERSARAVEV